MKFQSKLSNGSWHDETKPSRVEMFINKAFKADVWIARNEGREPRSVNEIKAALADGEVVKYDGDWYAEIRDADAQAPKYSHGIASTYERTLDCGHTVYNKSEVMTASRGSSCHRCYDRMSD